MMIVCVCVCVSQPKQSVSQSVIVLYIFKNLNGEGERSVELVEDINPERVVPSDAALEEAHEEDEHDPKQITDKAGLVPPPGRRHRNERMVGSLLSLQSPSGLLQKVGQVHKYAEHAHPYTCEHTLVATFQFGHSLLLIIEDTPRHIHSRAALFFFFF